MDQPAKQQRPEVRQLGQKCGWFFVALKAVQLILTDCVWRCDPAYLSWSPSLSVARIIPSFHRKLIIKQDDRADLLVKVYMSFFSLSQVICLAKRVDKNTLTSMVTKSYDMNSVFDWLDEF